MALGSVSCSSEGVNWRAFTGQWYTGRGFTVMNQTSVEIWPIAYMHCNIQQGGILNEHCWVSKKIETQFLLQLTWSDIPDGFASSPPHAVCSLETILCGFLGRGALSAPEDSHQPRKCQHTSRSGTSLHLEEDRNMWVDITSSRWKKH